MNITEKHINLFDKLHKLYYDREDVPLLEKEFNLSNSEATELANSITAFRFLNDFNTNIDCQSIGFAGKEEMRQYFHEWLQSKKWKGLSNVSNLSALLRKFSQFRKADDKKKQFNTLINKKRGNKNSLKFDDRHITIFNDSFVVNDIQTTYIQYIEKCENNNIIPVSKATVYNYYKKQNENLTNLIKASNIDHLQAQFVALTDFDIFQKTFGCSKDISAQLINSVACLEMLNYSNLKAEIKLLGFPTKGNFLIYLLEWLKNKNFAGLNKISNTSVLRRKADEFAKTLKEYGREQALYILLNKKIGNKNRLKFDENHKAIVRDLVDKRIYESKIQCYRDYITECKKLTIKPSGEGTIIQYINKENLFEKYQTQARHYTVPSVLALTDEQIEIINYDGDLKINAVAGSGKTTTLIEYAKDRDNNVKFLYIAFNKSVKDEAIRKIKTKGLKNIDIVTAHSLAYKFIVNQETKHLLASNLSQTEILNALDIEYDEKDKKDKIILATHIRKLFEYYCNSSVSKISEINYLDIVFDDEAKLFIETNSETIKQNVILLYNKMDKGEMRFTHDFYLKKFQLSNPKLDYDYIFFDEGQDASPAMLDVFLKQKAKKIIVGDINQQIYSWRYAINSLDKIVFKRFDLSKSFRFGRNIANLALDSLELKKLIGIFQPTTISGLGTNTKIKTKATLARTNLKLLELAIDDVFTTKSVKSIYFEGHISTYKFGEKNSILYDVLNLYYNKPDRIKNALIKEFSKFKELVSFAKKTEDAELSMIISLVMRYKGELPSLIHGLKEIHLTNGKKQQADMIYSTVHKCKGMEYDEVTLANDFYTESTIIEECTKGLSPQNINKINEEINLLYVAITRAKTKINIPDELLPSTLSKFRPKKDS